LGVTQYQDFDSYLIPKPTFEILKSEGPLPLNIETDIDRYLEDRRAILDRELSEVAALATAGKLKDVDLSGGELAFSRPENHDLAAVSICKLSAAGAAISGEFDYFGTLATPMKIKCLAILHGRK
jgi:hypothetical protein